jgi:hypothetical protein
MVSSAPKTALRVSSLRHGFVFSLPRPWWHETGFMVQRSTERETMEARQEKHGQRNDLTYAKSRRKITACPKCIITFGNAPFKKGRLYIITLEFDVSIGQCHSSRHTWINEICVWYLTLFVHNCSKSWSGADVTKYRTWASCGSRHTKKRAGTRWRHGNICSNGPLFSFLRHSVPCMGLVSSTQP